MGNWNDYHDGFHDGIVKANEIALELENRWRRSAERVREQGSFFVGWFKRRKVVAKAFEQNANDIEAAADGIRTIRFICAKQKPSRARANEIETAERTIRAWHKVAREMCDLAIKGDCDAIERVYFDAAMSLPFYGADPDPLPSQR